MHLSELSVWGAVLVLLLLFLSVGLFWLTDRRLLGSVLGVRVRFPRVPVRQWLFGTLTVVACGALVAGCVVLSVPLKLFLPVLAVLLVCLLLSTPRAMQTYVRSLQHTENHRRYMLANGASHLESVMPSVRRALRTAVLPLLSLRSPVVIAMPLLFCGMLIGGATLAAALAVTLLLWASAFAASVLASVLAIWLIDKP